MLVKIDDYEAIEMLVDRVEYWTEDYGTIQLFRAMYESYVDGGIFEGGEFDVKQIVDNDYINWCKVLEEGDEEYEEIKKIFDEQGLGDCSCENGTFAYIESEYDGMFLVRYK